MEYSSLFDKMSAQDGLQRVAFSVYSQARLLLADHAKGIIPKSMTKFGPASIMMATLDNVRDNQRAQPTFYKVKIELSFIRKSIRRHSAGEGDQ